MPTARATIRSLTAAASLSAAAAAPADVRFVLITPDLIEQLVTLSSIDNGLIEYQTETGLIRREPLGSVLAIIEPALLSTSSRVRAGHSETWALETVDGRRLYGSPAGTVNGGDTIAFSTERFGAIEVDLDRIDRLIRFGTDPAAHPDATDDIVTLINGDTVSGFMLALGSESIEFETGGASVELPLERVVEIELANPDARPEGMTLWLDSGAVVQAESFSRAEPNGAPPAIMLIPAMLADTSESDAPNPNVVEISLAEIRGAVFDAGALRPLSSVEPEDERPVGDRRWAAPMRRAGSIFGPLGAGDLVLPGPMEVRWRLPEAAARVAFDAELATTGPWSECEIVVLLDDGPDGASEIARASLSGTNPTQRINAELGGAGLRRLVIRLEPGEFGPIRDRVILRRPLLLID